MGCPVAGGGELYIDRDLPSHRTAPLIIPLPTAAEIAGVSNGRYGKAKEVITNFS